VKAADSDRIRASQALWSSARGAAAASGRGRVIQGDVPPPVKEARPRLREDAKSDLGRVENAQRFWCIVEDDRNGSPKKVMAEVIGEAARLAPGRVEAVWLTDKASEAGLKQVASGGFASAVLRERRVRAVPERGLDGCRRGSRAKVAPRRSSRRSQPSARVRGAARRAARRRARRPTGPVRDGGRARRDPAGLRGQASLEVTWAEVSVGSHLLPMCSVPPTPSPARRRRSSADPDRGPPPR